MVTTARLLIGTGAEMHYATGIDFPDAQILLVEANGHKTLVASALEYGLAKTGATVNTVIHSNEMEQKAKAHFGTTGVAAQAAALLAEKGIKQVIARLENAACLDELRAYGVEVVHPERLLFPEMETKSAAEIEKLRLAQQVNEVGMWCAVNMLQQAEIEANGTLSWQGAPLTSAVLRTHMQIAHLKAGGSICTDGAIIVAGGIQGADPHERGHGVLKAHELIVIDSFPRHPNGFFGDLTRTFIKGRIVPWQQAMYDAVLAAHNTAASLIKAGANAQAIHQQATDALNTAGFPTETGTANNGPYGFFHGLGHGIGMILHEGPGISSRSARTLHSGFAVTNEPGVYYKGNHPNNPSIIGGVRIEDIVVVTAEGHQNLTDFPKQLNVNDLTVPAAFAAMFSA